MEGLSFDNILGEQDIENLFEPYNEEPKKENAEPEDSVEEEEETETTTTEEVDPDELFGGEQPESVGSGKDKEVREKEDAVPDEESGASPNNFYSSIANALAVDGIFPNLDEEAVKKANTAESFSELIDAEVNARLDEKQRRVAQALDNNMEPSKIRTYEGTIQFLDSITDDMLAEESSNGEDLRRKMIYQDFINKGYTPVKAQKLTERTIDAGTDVEDAKEAIQSVKEYFQGQYNAELQAAQQQAEKQKEERKAEFDKVANSILEDKQLFGDMEISKELRKKAIDAIVKPVYKDPKTGEYLSALQKYEREHKGDFMKYIGVMYTVTNGFKDFESFTKGKVKKELKKGLKELEHTLNSTSRTSDGSLRMVAKRDEDPESFFKGFKLDF